MGRIEEEQRRRGRRNQVRRAILTSIKFAGLVALVAMTPNAISGLHKLGLVPTARQNETVKRSFGRLLKLGLIASDGKYVRLTEKGEREIRALEASDFKMQRPRRWDGQWRVLMFDIPERRKAMRERVRHTLHAMGFERLQDSVWIYPYDCEDVITLLKADMKIGKDMLYMVVSSLENDRELRREFDLPQLT